MEKYSRAVTFIKEKQVPVANPGLITSREVIRSAVAERLVDGGGQQSGAVPHGQESMAGDGNETFNVAKTYHRMEHICPHRGNSLLVSWLILLLALAIERFYRLRYLHRGRHPVRAAVDLVRALRLSLGRPFTVDTG